MRRHNDLLVALCLHCAETLMCSVDLPQGAVLGPKEFVKGLGRGGKGFTLSILHGVSSSLTGVTSSVGRNLALLTFDEQYKVSSPPASRTFFAVYLDLRLFFIYFISCSFNFLFLCTPSCCWDV